MSCLVLNCPHPVSVGAWYCRLHSRETVQAHIDWRRDDGRSRRQFLVGEALSPVELDTDWREQVVMRSVLPKGVGLFGSESAAWSRMRVRKGMGRGPTSPVEFYPDGLWPIEFRLAHVELKDVVGRVLGNLSLKEEVVIRLRFGILGFAQGDCWLAVDSRELSLDEVAEGLHLSRHVGHDGGWFHLLANELDEVSECPGGNKLRRW